MSLPPDFEWPGTGRASDVFQYIVESPEWRSLYLERAHRENCVASVYGLKACRITVSDTVAPPMRPARDTLAYNLRRGIRMCFERQFDVVRDAVVTSLEDVHAFMQFVVTHTNTPAVEVPFEARRDAVLDMMLEYIDSSSQWEQSGIQVAEDETGRLLFGGGVMRRLTLVQAEHPLGRARGVITAKLQWGTKTDSKHLCCTADVRACMDSLTELACERTGR